MKNNFHTLTILFILFYSVKLLTQQDDSKSEIHKLLFSIPDISVSKIDNDSNFKEAFEISVTQPLEP
jgi:hypothetical protein